MLVCISASVAGFTKTSTVHDKFYQTVIGGPGGYSETSTTGYAVGTVRAGLRVNLAGFDLSDVNGFVFCAVFILAK